MTRRRLTLLALSALLCTPPACDSQAGPATEEHSGAAHVHGQDEHGLVFLEPQHEAHPNWVDIGELELGEVSRATVKLANVERRAITIQSVLSGCSCTIPELVCVLPSGERVQGDPTASTEALVVPPGATLELGLRIDSRLSPARNKDKLVVVRMTTDDDSDPYVTIEVRMKIVAAFQTVPPEIDLQRIPRNAGGQGAAEIAAIGDSGRILLDVLETPPGLALSLIESTRAGAMPSWNLIARVDGPLPLGYQERTLKLRASGPQAAGEGRPFEVKLRWTAVEDVEIVPARLLFLHDGARGREVAQAELFARLPGQRLRILEHALSGVGVEGLTVTIEPAQPDAEGKSNRWRMLLDPGPTPKPGPIDGLLTLRTDDPQFPSFEVPVMRKR